MREHDDPFHAALRRAVERAQAVKGPDVVPKVAFELRRKVLHVVTAIVAVVLLLYLPLATVLALGVSGIFVVTMTWAIERRRVSRKFAGPLHRELATVLAQTRRKGEDYPWSPVLYTVSLILIALAHAFVGLPWSIAFAAYAILGIGDAASALVGVAYGRVPLAWNRKKSVEGSLAGLAAGFFGGVVLGGVPFALAGLAVPAIFALIVLVGATAGALAETIPRVEDNFVVPLAAALAMFGVAILLGVTLP